MTHDEWAPSDEYNEALAYMLLSERERLVVERFYAEHPGPAMLAWLTKMANKADDYLLERHREADRVLVGVFAGTAKAHAGRNGWGPYERRAFYAEVLEARRLDAEDQIVKRVLKSAGRPA